MTDQGDAISHHSALTHLTNGHKLSDVPHLYCGFVTVPEDRLLDRTNLDPDTALRGPRGAGPRSWSRTLAPPTITPASHGTVLNWDLIILGCWLGGSGGGFPGAPAGPFS